MKLADLYKRCINAKYTTVENKGDYAIEREGETLYLLFEGSDSFEDWKNNFSFPARPYSEMGVTWLCHKGFLKVWKSIKPYVQDAIMDQAVKHIVVIGYSHGAAIATLCHEYVWFNRPDLRDELEGYGFGSPRCFWGWFMSKKLKQRWENFHIIRNINDIVTHLPPFLFGFRHVNKVIKVGKKGKIASDITKISRVDAHMPDNYIYSLEEYDNRGGE